MASDVLKRIIPQCLAVAFAVVFIVVVWIYPSGGGKMGGIGRGNVGPITQLAVTALALAIIAGYVLQLVRVWREVAASKVLAVYAAQVLVGDAVTVGPITGAGKATIKVTLDVRPDSGEECEFDVSHEATDERVARRRLAISTSHVENEAVFFVKTNRRWTSTLVIRLLAGPHSRTEVHIRIMASGQSAPLLPAVQEGRFS